MQAQGRVARALGQALQPLGLTPTQARALAVLQDAAGALPTMAALTRAIPITAQAGTALVDVLVARGWVCRRSDPGDRRAVRLALLPAGAALLVAAQPRVDRVLATMLGGLPPAELQELRRLVDRVGNA